MDVKMAIVGSRNTGSVDFNHVMDELRNRMENPITEVISGGAKGYDTMAALWATLRGIAVTEMRPDYEKHGRAATFIRNRAIVDRADVVVAFWDGKSRGTKYTLDYAGKKNKATITIYTEANGNKVDLFGIDRGKSRTVGRKERNRDYRH